MKRILKTAMISVVLATTVFGTFTATAANIEPHQTGADVGLSSTALPFENTATTLDVDEDTLPQSYSSKDMNYVTPVRNQQNTESCWAFGSLATLESLLIKNGKLTTDESQWLSVAHMDAWGSTRSDGFGWQRTYNVSPGYPYIALGYLASWSGAVKESLFPFTTPLENINLDDPEDV
ncbi:MAG: C1 family peptidase, partial [Ruminococcus sp.]